MKIATNRDWTIAALIASFGNADPSTKIEFVRGTKQKTQCWCGCGGMTKNKFMPGHDSKFHALAKQVARGQAEMPESFVHEEAKADFMKWHDAEVPKFAAKQAEKAAKAKAREEAKKAKEEALKAEEMTKAVIDETTAMDVDSDEFSELYDEVTQ